MNIVGLLIPNVQVDNIDPNPDLWNTTDINWENAFRKWNEINLITDVDFRRIDLFEDEQITLTQTIQDVRDIEKVFTDFSKTFNVPASSTNNKVFKHYYRRDLISDAVPNGIFNANAKLNAILELNHKPFKTGYVVMNGVKLKNNQPESYNLTFYGQTVQLKDKVKDRKLSSLDFSEYNHDYNVTNVKNGLQTYVATLNDVSVTTAHIIYPFISHTNRFIYNSSAAGTTLENTRNLYYSGEQSTTSKGFHYTDLKPAIRIIDILDTIEQDGEIEMEFTDDFFKDTGFFANLYLWLHRNKGEIGVTPTNETNTNFIILNKIQSFTGDPLNFFDVGEVDFSPRFDGGIFRFRTGFLSQGLFQETMRVTWTITPSVNTKKFTGRFRKAGTGETITEVAHVSGTTNTQIDFTFQTDLFNTIDDHNIEFVIETTETSLAVSYSLSCTKTISTLGQSPDVYTISAGTIEPGNIVETLYVSDEIPDMKILNFLTGLFKTFNLTAFVESDVSSADFGKIKVQTLDSFYSGGTTRDISEYIDITQSESNFAVPFNDIEFTFQDPKTFGAFYYNKLNNREYGSVKASDATQSGRDPRLNRGQDYRVETPFEKMFFERLKDSNDESDSQIGYGFFVDDKQAATIGQPLIFFKKTTPTSTKTIQMYNGASVGTPAQITSYNRPTNFELGTSSVAITVGSGESTAVTFTYLDENYASQTIAVSPSATGNVSTVITNSVRANSNVDDVANITIAYTEITPSQTLNFSKEIDPFNFVIDENTLFKSYYQEYISDVFSENRRLVKVNAMLPQSFLLNYKLSDTLIINDEEFIINKITTNLQTGKSSLELLNKIKSS